LNWDHPSTVFGQERRLRRKRLRWDGRQPVKIAQQLVPLATRPEEQEFAKEALRLSDYELDLSFNIACRMLSASCRTFSPRKQNKIQARLRKARNFQQALQAQVDQSHRGIAKAGEAKKVYAAGTLDLAKAALDVCDQQRWTMRARF